MVKVKKTAIKNDSKKIRLIVRADDMGMLHSCNLAIEKLFEEGILTCAAIQAVAPWAEEAAKMANEHLSWCIGAHLAVVGEWRGYRWRPVLPYDKIPSLVDKNGFLHRSPKEFYAGKPDFKELEKELRAQVDLIANRWGVKLGYLDWHYIGDKAYVAVIKKIAKDYKLPVSGRMGEKRLPKGIYSQPNWMKENDLAESLETITPGLWLLVTHPLVDSAEAKVLMHTEPADVMKGGVGNLRAGELQCLLSPRIKEIIVRRGIELVDYRLFKDKV